MLWADLPPFLLCEDHETGEGRTFLLHTRAPRFLMDFLPGGEDAFLAIDHVEAAELPKLRRKAREFFTGES